MMAGPCPSVSSALRAQRPSQTLSNAHPQDNRRRVSCLSSPRSPLPSASDSRRSSPVRGRSTLPAAKSSVLGRNAGTLSAQKLRSPRKRLNGSVVLRRPPPHDPHLTHRAGRGGISSRVRERGSHRGPIKHEAANHGDESLHTGRG
ncbi:hypothetical protein THAOC_25187, partial [Thalassiosira oceanica]